MIATTTGIAIPPRQSVTNLTAYDTSAVFCDHFPLPRVKAMIKNHTADAVAPMLNSLRAETTASLEKKTAVHASWRRDFWSKSYLDVPSEPAIEAQWYGKLYLLGRQVTVGQFPPGLLGWVYRDKGVYANDDLHLNWNVQFQFKGTSLAKGDWLKGGAFFDGWLNPDSTPHRGGNSWSRPYPCPRPCGVVRLGARPSKSVTAAVAHRV